MDMAQLGGLLFLLLVAGLFAGFVGGLFGIGGGIIMVPVLFFIFGLIDISEEIRLTLAIGTSLSVIIVTAIRSLLTHLKSGQVDTVLLKSWLVWIGGGALIAGFAAKEIPTPIMTLVFAIGAAFVGCLRLRRSPSVPAELPMAADDKKSPAVRHWAERFAPMLGMATGFVCSLLGLGGGAAGVMIMGWIGRDIHKAVATASGFGLGVAIPGAIGFAIAGWANPLLPSASVGFIYLPAFGALAAMSALSAPIGARMSHRLKAEQLSTLFGVYVLVMACLMIRESLNGLWPFTI